MKGLSVSLPGLEKSIRHTILVRPPVQCLADELTAVVSLDAFGNAPLGGQLTHDTDDLLTLDVLVGVDRQALSGELIYDRQGTEASTVEEGIRNEVHRPAVVGSSDVRPSDAVARHAFSLGTLSSKVEPSQTVDAVHTLEVDVPALALQQDVDPPVAVTNPHSGDLLDPLTDGCVENGTFRSVAYCRTVYTQSFHGSALAHPVALLQSQHEFPHPGWLRNFFTSCNIALSRLRSATSCLSFLLLLLELPQAPQLRHAKTRELLFPGVKVVFGDAHLAADLSDRYARLRLLEGEGDLLFGEFRSFYLSLLGALD